MGKVEEILPDNETLAVAVLVHLFRGLPDGVRVGELHVAGIRSLVGFVLCKKVPVKIRKFRQKSSVLANGLCIGCLGEWAANGRKYSSMQESFYTTLYRVFFPICRKVWKMTFWKVPMAGELKLQLQISPLTVTLLACPKRLVCY